HPIFIEVTGGAVTPAATQAGVPPTQAKPFQRPGLQDVGQVKLSRPLATILDTGTAYGDVITLNVAQGEQQAREIQAGKIIVITHTPRALVFIIETGV